MANRERGDVRLEIDGRAHLLRLTTNAMCQIEGALHEAGRPMSFPEFAARLKYAHVQDMRLFVWATLLDEQPHLTVEDAGTFMDAAGGPVAFAERHIHVMLGTAEPDPEDVQALGGRRDDPRRAAAGIGERSRSRRGVRAFVRRLFGDSRSGNSFASSPGRASSTAIDTTAP